MSNAMKDYFDALQRLVEGKGTKITNDAVSLEAGRSKGSIKKSRPEFTDLIKAIEKASKGKETALQKSQNLATKFKAERDEYKQLHKDSLNRELMLLERNAFLEKELHDIKIKNPLLKV